jgi:hypothetical protein
MSVDAPNAFISRWSKASPSERANSQLFLSELCDLLAVPHPDPSRDTGYGFEYEVTQHHPDGSSSKLPWPKTLSERVKAVSLALASYKEPVTPETLAKRFLRAKPKDISEIVETLCTMGHARRGNAKGTFIR